MSRSKTVALLVVDDDLDGFLLVGNLTRGVGPALLPEEDGGDAEDDPGAPVRHVQRVADAERLLD